MFFYGFCRRQHPTLFCWFPSFVFVWFPSSQETFFNGFRRGLFMVSVVAGKLVLWFPSLDFWLILPPQEDPEFQNVSCDSSFFVFLGLVSIAGCVYGFRYVFVNGLRYVFYGFRR